MKRTPFYRRPGRTGQFSGLRERVIWMIQTRGRPVTGSEIAEKFGVTLIEFNRVANGITRGSGQIAQIVESEKWLNEDGICDRTFILVTKPKVVTPQGKSRLFTRRAIEQSQEGRRQECIERAARRNQEAIELAEAWGFTVRTMKGFTWVKLNQNAELRINKALAEGEVADFYDFLALLNAETRMNGGNYTRANTEDVLIATCGAGLERKHAGIKQVVYSPLGAHSEKPWEVRHRLELLYGDVPRIELFSRSAAQGWNHWGNQYTTASVELIPGCAIDVVKTEAA